jgi:hypothetical protein
VTPQKAGLVPGDGAIRLKDAIEAFLRFTDKPLVGSKQDVVDGLAQACLDGLIGIAWGASASSVHSRACRRAISIDPSEEGVWVIPPFAEAQPGVASSAASAEASASGATPAPALEGAVTSHPASGGGAGTEAGRPTRAVRRVRIEGAVPLESYNELFRCFVGPAARMNLKRLTLGIGFVLEPHDDAPLDADDANIKGMREPARQLGLSLAVEE